MIKTLLENIKNIDKKTFKIMDYTFKASFVVCIISSIIALAYILNPISHVIYASGIILFKTSITFAVSFFICAFAIDKIKKQLV